MTETLAPKSDTRRIQAGRLQSLLRAAGVFVIVAALFVAGMLTSGKFLTADNLLNILRAVTLLGIVVVGVSFITYSGHYVDLSIPGIMAMSGIVAVAALPMGFLPAVCAGLSAGVLVGAINGYIVGYLRVNPIIWTLAMMSILDGLMRWYFQGRQIYPDGSSTAGAWLLWLYNGTIMGYVPLIFVVLVVLAIAGSILMARTSYGARLKLVGSAYEPARMTGIHVNATVALAFMISGFTAAIAGILLTSFNRVGSPTVGAKYDFNAVTAVVIGGVTLAGGRGSVISALGGVLIIGLLQNIMTLFHIHIFGQDVHIGSFEQVIVQGFVFILAVGIQSYALRRAGRDDA
jgi:ribose/xylose/arabinose/galactoside ABC-type transport system permease subunit